MQDYAKLAAELGGKPAGPDYAALAREAGGETRESDKPKSSAKAPSLVDTALMDIPAMPAAIRGGLAILRGVKQNPVAAGALAGGLATAPMTGGASIPASMAFAGLGAAGGAGLGSAAEQLGTGRPKDASTVLTEMVREGSAQATGQGVGAVVAKTAGVVAPKILKGILRPTRRLQDEFGDVVGVGLRERIPVGSSNVANARMSESAAQARGMVKAAEDAGVPGVNPREVIKELRPVRDVIKRRADIGMPNETGEIAGRARAFLRAHTTPGAPGRVAPRVATGAGPDSVDAAVRASSQLGPQATLLPTSIFGGDPALVNAARQLGPLANVVPRRLLGSSAQPATVLQFGDDVAPVAPRVRDIPLSRAQELKSEAQDMASRTFRAIEQGNPVRDTSALADKAIATGLRKGIEQRVPGVADVNRRTQELMGLQEALEAAEARSGGIVGLNPANWMSGLAPGLGSKLAFTLDGASKAPLPGMGRNLAALLTMLASQNQNEQ